MKYLEKLPEKIKDVVFLTAVFPGLNIDDFLFIYKKYSEFQNNSNTEINSEKLFELTTEFSYLLKTDKSISFADKGISKIIFAEIIESNSLFKSVEKFLNSLETDKMKIKLIEAIVNSEDHGFIEKAITALLEDKKATFKNMGYLLKKIYKFESTEMKWLVVYFIERRDYSLESTHFLIDLVKTELDFEIRWNAAEALKLFHTRKTFPVVDAVAVLIDDIEAEIRKIGFDIFGLTKNIDALVNSFKSIVDFKEDEIRSKALDIIDARIKKIKSDELYEALRLYAELGNTIIKSRLIQLLTNNMEHIGSQSTVIVGALLSDEKTEVRIKTYDFLEKLSKIHPVEVVNAINRYGIKEMNFVVRKIIGNIIKIVSEMKIEEKLFQKKIMKLKEAIL